MNSETGAADDSFQIKKSKNIYVDLYDSDCEMTTNYVVKKKKKKRPKTSTTENSNNEKNQKVIKQNKKLVEHQDQQVSNSDSEASGLFYFDISGNKVNTHTDLNAENSDGEYVRIIKEGLEQGFIDIKNNNELRKKGKDRQIVQNVECETAQERKMKKNKKRRREDEDSFNEKTENVTPIASHGEQYHLDMKNGIINNYENLSSSTLCDGDSPNKKRKNYNNNFENSLNSHFDNENKSQHDDCSQFILNSMKNHQETSDDDYDASDEDNSPLWCKSETFQTEDDLNDLKIILPFRISRLHSLASVSCKLYKKELDRIEAENIPVKTGHFTKAEDEIIIKNWNHFLKMHHLNVPPSMFFNLTKALNRPQRLNFLKFIAHGLDNRFLHGIHARFKRIFNKPNLVTGRFTEEDDKLILETIEKYGRTYGTFAKLAEELRRDSKTLVKHYNLLIRPNEIKKKVRWDVAKANELVQNLMRATKCERIEELKDFDLRTKIWKKVSKRMNDIPIYKLRKAWYYQVHPRLFAHADMNKIEVKKLIVKKIYKSGINDIRLVDWKELAEHCSGLNSFKVYMMFIHMYTENVPKEKRADFRASVKHLRKYIKLNGPGHCLSFTRYIYKDGRLQKVQVERKNQT